MVVENILFWIFAVAAVSAALGVVFHRSIIYSALFLIVVFLSIAGVFVLNNADFLAVAQTIVYGVGLTIIILFGIMFTGDRLFNDRAVTRGQFAAYLLVGAMLLAILLPAVMFQYNILPIPAELIAIYKAEGSTGLLGMILFNKYALPFEVASILLLLAMVGAIVLSKKDFDEEGEASVKYELPSTGLRPEAEAAYSSAPFQGMDTPDAEAPDGADAEETEEETVGV